MNLSIKNSINSSLNLNELSIHKTLNKNNINKNSSINYDKDVILELSQAGLLKSKAKPEKLTADEALGDNILQVLEYENELLATEKMYKANNKYGEVMMGVTEKYYSMIDSLKEKYGDSESFIRHKGYLDRALDMKIDLYAMGVAANFTAPLIKSCYSIQYQNNKYYVINGKQIEDSGSLNMIKKNNSKLPEYQNEIRGKIFNDTVNMFNNIKGYYENNKSFIGINSNIISLNNKYMKYDDIDYMHNLNNNTGINDKLNQIYKQSDETDINKMYDELRDTVNSMDCSSIFKDMYNKLLDILFEEKKYFKN